MRASHGQRRSIPFPSGPMQAGDHAAHRPRGHVDPLRPAGAVRHTEPLRGPGRGQGGGSAADTGACPSGHLDAPDAWTPDAWTPDAWTPDAWTLDVRSTGWTDIARRTGRGGQGNDRPGRRPDSSRPASTPGRPDLARVAAPGALGHPGWLRGDGTCAAALTAAAPGQLPSTARHQAAPRRSALLG
jgi:hypothetical protein